jgi:single-strand DNA-binding protein
MPKSVNKVILVGNVGKFLCHGLAPTKGSKIAAVSARTRTEWHNIVALQRLAEIVGEYVARGYKLYVEGKLQTSSWEDRQSGERKYRTEIVARDLLLLGLREIVAVTTKSRPQTTTRISGPKPALARAGTRIFHSDVCEIPAHPYEGRAVMTPTNGHANDPANGSANAVQQLAPPASDTNIPFHLHFVSVTRDTDGGNTTP